MKTRSSMKYVLRLNSLRWLIPRATVTQI